MTLRTTARFDIERRTLLKKLFTRSRLCYLWRTLVKDQMRRFEVTDLHDYYDFNFAIEARVDAIVERVLAGQYRADAPLIYRAEKKLGICRHLMIPTPSDALVFQLLADALYPAVVSAQPSKQAFYARDRHELKLPHEHREFASYPWHVLWPRFQKEIWKFSESFGYLVTTDLSNYFDSIGLRELRHVISAIARTEEVYLDLLFSLIEDLSWKPDYLPTSHTGLPTISIEAPRLLGHAFIFEVDAVLQERTKGSFVRWMDDINFGVDTIRAAKTILAEISDVLKSRGLALNLAKTQVLTAKEAFRHFMIRENQVVGDLQRRAKLLKTPKTRARMAAAVSKKLSTHLETCTARSKDKITKRYLTLLSTLGSPVALGDVESVFAADPSMRQSVLRYLSSLPFQASVAKSFLRLYDDTEQFDDVTRFAYASAVVRWPVPLNKAGLSFISGVGGRLKAVKSPFEWLCRLVFLAKYGAPDVILKTAFDDRRLAKEPFLARQRVTILARAMAVEPKTVIKEWRAETAAGYPDSASVASNFLMFHRETFPLLRSRAYPYLFPEVRQNPYPLPKFLLLCPIAYADRPTAKARPVVDDYVKCPWFRKWLSGINSFWFVP